MSWREVRRELAFTRAVLGKRPFSLLLQVTNRCNMKCSFCDFWPHGAPPKDELTTTELRDLADQLTGLGRFLISIEGGEPFVRPDLVEIVRLFARDHLPMLYTNGWYVTPDSAQALFEAGLTQVGVSIDYADPARHDAKRVLGGATERAWQAVRQLKAAAPHGGKQVHVMTVLTADNADQIAPLLDQTAAAGVGFALTLLARTGFRRGADGPDQWPAAGVGRDLLALWKRHRQWRYWGEYLERIDDFLQGRPLPTCTAGVQGFNVDHLGNVAPCIEKIDRVIGNLREEPLAEIHRRMVADRTEIDRCQDCWTACRGMSQLLGNGGSARAWWGMATRMRSR